MNITSIPVVNAKISPVVLRTCLICHADDKETLHSARLPENIENMNTLHHQYQEGLASHNWRYRIVRCRKCGHRFADPIFERSFIESSYLFQNHDNEFELDRNLLMRTNEGYANLVKPYLPKQDQRHLQVDLGCDTGIFMRATRQFSFQRTVGIEPGEDSARRAAEIPGVEVLRKVFEPADFEKNSIGFASLIHVLDHLTDSAQVIRDLRPMLADDGVVIAVVHNIDSLISKISGEQWAPLNLVHMDYFGPKSLAQLFKNEGYKVEKVVLTKNYFPLEHLVRFAPFLGPKLRAGLIRLIQISPFRSLVLGLKLGNIAVIARKK